ncbi:hypothetical protein CK625_12765 [Vandammella animalimorsus]|uniref:4-amino-4-deoxy-L-arabinose transferase-like glycosyltransferase n=1 Tax=Vandammella animalimorsus TaxID=2029117 RepID=A0A2A2A9T0_9BURK|nr:hypothetical protein CK625_12765 [Vandammella animalimorsus]
MLSRVSALPPSPAIVSQSAVRPLARAVLWALSLVYVCAGFIGRHPWKNEDMAAYGYMQALAQGQSSWLQPELLGQGLGHASQHLSVWLGALALLLRPDWLAPTLAVRLPFMGLMLASLAAVWYATYHLARRPEAQPVPFAFGGEAEPVAYARAIADGSVLALVASLGLMQFSHETTATVVQLGGASLLFLALALPEARRPLACSLAALACAALLLSGGAYWLAPVLLATLLLAWQLRGSAARLALPLPLLGALALLAVLSAAAQAVWHSTAWPLTWPGLDGAQWLRFVRLLIWFGWPAWPLACWALYRWRRHWLRARPSLHLALPLLWLLLTLALAACAQGSARDRTLFLSLPMAATLAAFALPTMRRALSSLIDWFTLLFFTACGVAIWVIWTATQTGLPAKPAANVAKLAPEYVPQFSALAFGLAALSTAIWLAVIAWRTGRHRSALWKSLVLPAGGATWCLTLVMTLWLPMLDYGRSYQPQIDKLAAHIPQDAPCLWAYELGTPQLAAFWAQAGWPLRQRGANGPAAQAPADAQACPLSLVGAHASEATQAALQRAGWRLQARIERPTSDEAVLLFAAPLARP